MLVKKCQTNEGGFNYTLGDGENMIDGSKAGMATLALMSKFDNQVMIKAYQFLLKVKTSSGEFPYYGFFYGCMGMQLLGQEFGDFPGRKKDGTWPLEGWAANSSSAKVAHPDYPYRHFHPDLVHPRRPAEHLQPHAAKAAQERRREQGIGASKGPRAAPAFFLRAIWCSSRGVDA